MTKLSFSKTHPDVVLPKCLESQAGCFSIAYQGHGKDFYTVYDRYNKVFTRTTPKGQVYAGPNERVAVPTGLVPYIPTGYSLKISVQPDLALTRGLVLLNNFGNFESGEELILHIHNLSDVGISLVNGDKLALGQLIKKETLTISELKKEST